MQTQSSPACAGPLLDEALLARLDRPGPRYTSYPTADRFHEGFTAEHYEVALRENFGQDARKAPLSLYVHVPFCESVCYYCACNKVITRHHERATEYLEVLGQEMALHARALACKPTVSQLHLGGGTPTFLSDAELTQLMSLLRANFRIAAGAEISIEVDPRTVTAERLRHFFSIGFNRLSFGVQDFDPAVQRAVHRVQSHDMVADLMRSARETGFESINVDLIYGLPQQTAQSFARTVEQVSALRPDRIALYAYAHLPQRFMPQRRIAAADLPPPAVRVAMLGGAIEGFLSSGYDYIGMDHFALEGDSLAQAKRQGRLHRNFQGYSTQPDCDLIALGVSAIGRIGSHYGQNAKTLPEYYAAIRSGQFATVRGYRSTREDLLRRAVIMALMCQGRVDFESIEVNYLIDFQRHFAPELERLQAMRAEGMVTVDAHSIAVTPQGWYLVRAIAMVFDAYLRSADAAQRFSRIG